MVAEKFLYGYLKSTVKLALLGVRDFRGGVVHGWSF
jgi:hypothetical protein